MIVFESELENVGKRRFSWNQLQAHLVVSGGHAACNICVVVIPLGLPQDSANRWSTGVFRLRIMIFKMEMFLQER